MIQDVLFISHILPSRAFCLVFCRRPQGKDPGYQVDVGDLNKAAPNLGGSVAHNPGSDTNREKSRYLLMIENLAFYIIPRDRFYNHMFKIKVPKKTCSAILIKSAFL